jgi:hypothetical protein
VIQIQVAEPDKIFIFVGGKSPEELVKGKVNVKGTT